VLRVEGRSGTYAPAGGAAFADTRFELPEEPARGAAETLELGVDGKVTLSQVWFTTCPETSPDWRIRARRIELDTRNRNGTGRSAAIEFKGVPILYLPYLSFPLGDQRKSGFLFPNAGYSSRGGAELRVPYYLNLAPNYDLTLEPTIYGRRGIDLGASFRYLTHRHRGDLRINTLESDKLRNIARNWLRVRHRTALPASWRFDIDAQSVSDAEYFEDVAHDSGIAMKTGICARKQNSFRRSIALWSLPIGLTRVSLAYRRVANGSRRAHSPCATVSTVNSSTSIVMRVYADGEAISHPGSVSIWDRLRTTSDRVPAGDTRSTTSRTCQRKRTISPRVPYPMPPSISGFASNVTRSRTHVRG
jgi:lipopolysaccharide assembly outer membrane protein LptD (OstA)